MKIIIATGIYPPDIGGPAKYAKNLAEEFVRKDHKVKVFVYKIEKKLPIGIRHLFYCLRLIFNLWQTDLILALDTFSAGMPAVVAGKLFRKKVIIRIGGDFLWETYTEKTGHLITTRSFYEKMPRLPLKYKIIFHFFKFTLKNCSALVFSTDWQREILSKVYNLDKSKTFVIENFYPAPFEKKHEINQTQELKEKNFFWAGRLVKWKNLETLKNIFNEIRKENPNLKLEIHQNIPHNQLMEKIKNCYAVILPSLTEVSPNLILEVISFNKPFILTKETGFYEKMKHIGLFVDPLDKKDIKNKILFLAKDKNYNEYKRRISNFNFTHSWSKIAEEFISIFKKL